MIASREACDLPLSIYYVKQKRAHTKEAGGNFSTEWQRQSYTSHDIFESECLPGISGEGGETLLRFVVAGVILHRA